MATWIVDELFAVIGKVKYPPERIPFATHPTLSVGDNRVYDLKNFPRVIVFDGLSLVRRTEVTVKQTADKRYFELKAGSLLNLGALNPLSVFALRNISLLLHSTTSIPNYQIFQPLWVIEPNIAQKLVWGSPLTNQEIEIARKRDIYSAVEKGVLPFPISYQILREYIGYDISHSKIIITVPVGLTDVDAIRPEAGQFLVLLGISIERPPSPATNTGLYISRDEDKDYLKVPGWCMDLDYEIPCFVPALRELRISIYSEVSLSNVRVRYRVGYYKLTNILKARWNLEEVRERIPDLWQSLQCGAIP